MLSRLIDRPGPVLADFGESRMGFFVPPGTASRWLGTGIRGRAPAPGSSFRTRAARPGVRWLIPPDGSGTLTDAGLLELAMHEAAGAAASRHDRGGGWPPEAPDGHEEG